MTPLAAGSRALDGATALNGATGARAAPPPPSKRHLSRARTRLTASAAAGLAHVRPADVPAVFEATAGYRARWALDNSLQDRNALAAALDAADVREAAVARALGDRAGSLATIGSRTVEGYLEERAWIPGRRRAEGRGFEVWRHRDVGGVVAAWPDEGGDRVASLWDVACACGAVEGRHPTLVLAEWLWLEARVAPAGGPR